AVVYYNLGNALHSRKGRLAEAVAAYREAIRLNNDYPQAHNNLGHALLDLRDVEGAIGEFRQAIGTKQVFPEAYNARHGLGNALKAKGRLEDSIAEYREAIRIKPKFADAHYGLGNAFFPKRLNDAIAEYREAIRINPDHAKAHTNLGNCMAMKGDLE